MVLGTSYTQHRLEKKIKRFNTNDDVVPNDEIDDIVFEIGSCPSPPALPTPTLTVTRVPLLRVER